MERTWQVFHDPWNDPAARKVSICRSTKPLVMDPHFWTILNGNASLVEMMASGEY
jgi:hypothetical protein